MLLSNQQKYIISVLRQIKYIRSCQLCALTAQHYLPQGIEISQHRMDVMLRQLRAGTNFVRLQEDIVCYGKRAVDPRYLEAIDVMLELSGCDPSFLSSERLESPFLLRFTGSGEELSYLFSERKKLDDAYLNALKKLGLEPAAASGIQSLLMPKTAPEQKAAGDKQPSSAPVQDQRSGGTAQQSAEPQNRSAQQKPQAGSKKQEHTAEPTGKTVPFRNTAQAMPEEDIYTVLAAKVQGGMSGSNTLVNLETPEKKQTYAYVRGIRPELTPGTQLSHVRLTTRKQDTVVFCVLESYDVYQQGQQAA